MADRLFELVVRVSRAQGSPVPEGASHALAPCFVFAADYEEALRRCVEALAGRLLVLEEVAPGVAEIPLERWSEHVQANWAEIAHYLPDGQRIGELAAERAIFFGPLAGFEPAAG